MNDKIEAWINRLDKYNICPYAAKSRRCIVEGDYNNLVEHIQNWDDSFEVIIFVFEDDISVKLAELVNFATSSASVSTVVLSVTAAVLTARAEKMPAPIDVICAMLFNLHKL